MSFYPFQLPVWRDSSNVKRERAVWYGYGIETVSSDRGILLGIILYFCHFLSDLKGLTLLEILRTLEALARLEVEEVHSLEEPGAVCPSCDVLLILRRLALILVGAEGLHEWVGGWAWVFWYLKIGLLTIGTIYVAYRFVSPLFDL